MDRIVGERFRLRRRIGAGSFGEIYSAENIQSHRRVAVKLESTRTPVPQLSYESRIYAILAGGTGIPRFYWYGTEEFQNAMVIELLDKSLEDLLELCGRKLSLKTVLMIVDQTLSCLEYIHSKNLIHRDIKPDNFVMGLGNNASQVFIIDFGLAKRYRDPNTHEHCRFMQGKPLTGTARYASVRAMEGCEQSRRDDLESLGYVWMYLLRGDLPWMGLNIRDSTQKCARIAEVKKNTTFEQLCSGFPDEFVRYLYAVRELRFSDTPRYSQYRKMFRDLFIRCGYVYDCVYDWNVRNPEEPVPARKVMWKEESKAVQRSAMGIVRSQPNLLEHSPPQSPVPNPGAQTPVRSRAIEREVAKKVEERKAETPKRRLELGADRRRFRTTFQRVRYSALGDDDRKLRRTATEDEFKVTFGRQTKTDDRHMTPRRNATEQKFEIPPSRIIPVEESSGIPLRSTRPDVQRRYETRDPPIASYLMWKNQSAQSPIRQSKSTSYFPVV